MESLLKQFEGNKFLITCSAWFVAPDGKSYRAAWGEVKVFDDKDTLGIKTNNQSTNWYAVVGKIGDGKCVIIAGCQIKYACVSMDRPVLNGERIRRPSDQQAKEYEYDSQNVIYIAE